MKNIEFTKNRLWDKNADKKVVGKSQSYEVLVDINAGVFVRPSVKTLNKFI